MGFFNKFKSKASEKKVDEKKVVKKDEKSPEKKVDENKVEKKSDKTSEKTSAVKGKTSQAYRVLVKPLITEKASSLGVFNKYAFAVDPRMNKIEVKKAIRTIYNVEPVSVNILNFSGKSVRYGRVKGKTKSWKKAIVTLRQGDKIEVYEGV